MDRVNLTIEGMSCDHCLAAVKGALQRVEGAKVERVEIGSATVSYDPSRATVEEMVDEVADEGYTAYMSE
jgi:copper chaperone CopZ